MRARHAAAAALAATAVPLALAPAGAQAAATRVVQAVDSQTLGQYWTPNALGAQNGDTLQWNLTEPGNPIANQHNIWIIKPGADPSTAVQLGDTTTTPTVSLTLDQDGTYQYYCSIHGGLAPGGMNGTITVGPDDPGPPVDPGQPWLTGDVGPGAPIPTGPAPLLNGSAAPVVFEQGDLKAPRLIGLRVSALRGGVKVSVRASRKGRISVRVLRGWKPVKTRTVAVKGGYNELRVVDRRKLKAGRYRVQVVLADAHDLTSTPSSKRVRIGR